MPSICDDCQKTSVVRSGVLCHGFEKVAGSGVVGNILGMIEDISLPGCSYISFVRICWQNFAYQLSPL